MKKTLAIAGATVLAGAMSSVIAPAMANDGFYIGPSVTGYYLDSDRVVHGHSETYVGGLNLGYRGANDWAIEFGAGTNMGGDDQDVLKLDILHWFGEETQSWRPYMVFGGTYYELDDSNVYPRDKYSTQAHLGVGVSTMVSDHLEFRSDVRALQQLHNSGSSNVDGALNLALNYYFNGPPVAAPVVAVAEPAPAPVPAAEPEKRTITVRLNVEFEFDKAVVRAIYGDELNAIAEAMKAHDDIDLVLEGHTDSVGSDKYNQGLSERRAAAVKAKLAEMYGIDPSRISSVGYGESKPIADNKTADGRARNRRVIGELTFTEVAPN